ncbi:MAG: GAF domain-containing protein [Gammaproteobacteria bacterium]|jgi:GAF domain-containing protein
MNSEEDQDSLLESLRTEQRELLTEADSLRRFISCMRKLIDVAGSRQREAEVYLLFEQVLDNAISALNARDGSILVPDPETGELVFVMVRGDEPSNELVGRRLRPGEGIAGWTALNRRAAIVNNVSADDRFFAGVDQDLKYRTRSILAVPVIGGNKLLAVIEVLNKRDGRLFSVGNKTLLGLMCRFAGEVLYSLVRDADLSETGALIGAQRYSTVSNPLLTVGDDAGTQS